MKNPYRVLALIATASMLFANAGAKAAVLLDFNLSDCGFLAPIGDYYAGGTDCQGVQGPDVGVDFTSSALVEVDGRGQALVFESSIFLQPARLEIAGGFSDGLAFLIAPGSVPFNVTVGNDDGVLLSEILSNGQANWIPIGFDFDGVATWVTFTTNSELASGIDDLVLGSTTIIPIPAGVWLFGSACLVLAGRARRRK